MCVSVCMYLLFVSVCMYLCGVCVCVNVRAEVALELLQMRWIGESVNETAAIPHIPTRHGTRPAH